jgi:hypothetical protein
MAVLPPALLETLNVFPVMVNVTAAPDLTPIVNSLLIVTVDNPATGAVTEPTPEKLMLVTAVPTELPPNSSSTPEITPVSADPSPSKELAVTIPVALILFVSRVPSVPTPDEKLANLVASVSAIYLHFFTYL